MTVAGEDRSYRVALPDDFSEPAPVLAMFHGFTSNIEAMAANTGLAESGPAAGAVVVFAQAAGDPSSWRLIQGFDKDQAFLDAVLEQVTASDCIDSERIWLGGFSAGSAFTGRYGCAAPDRFEGLLMASGLPPPLCPEETDSPRILVVHGTADPVVSFEGGSQPVNEATIELASVPESTGQWAERAGCDATASEQSVGEAELGVVVGGLHPRRAGRPDRRRRRRPHLARLCGRRRWSGRRAGPVLRRAGARHR